MDFISELAKFEKSDERARKKLLRRQALQFDEFLVFQSEISDDAFEYFVDIVLNSRNSTLEELVEFFVSLETEFYKFSETQKNQLLNAFEIFSGYESAPVNKIAVVDLMVRNYPPKVCISKFKYWAGASLAGNDFAKHGCEAIIRIAGIPEKIKAEAVEILNALGST